MILKTMSFAIGMAVAMMAAVSMAAPTRQAKMVKKSMGEMDPNYADGWPADDFEGLYERHLPASAAKFPGRQRGSLRKLPARAGGYYNRPFPNQQLVPASGPIYLPAYTVVRPDGAGYYATPPYPVQQPDGDSQSQKMKKPEDDADRKAGADKPAKSSDALKGSSMGAHRQEALSEAFNRIFLEIPGLPGGVDISSPEDLCQPASLAWAADHLQIDPAVFTAICAGSNDEDAEPGHNYELIHQLRITENPSEPTSASDEQRQDVLSQVSKTDTKLRTVNRQILPQSYSASQHNYDLGLTVEDPSDPANGYLRDVVGELADAEQNPWLSPQTLPFGPFAAPVKARRA